MVFSLQHNARHARFTFTPIRIAVVSALITAAHITVAQTARPAADSLNQPAATAAPTANNTTLPRASATAPVRVAPVIVTGNPFERASAGMPWSVLTGDEFAERQSGTLGETLSGLPGIASTYFGPNSSRPIIRGLDAERIRVLENGASSVDAASLSFDHAVPIDPIAVERIEVLRGPSALLYGGSAVGGVVNAVSSRIPRTEFKTPSFVLQTQVGGPERVVAGAARADATVGDLTFHADASRRETEDLRVPEFVNPEGERASRIANSALVATSGALGISRAVSGANGGFIGASIDTYQSRYGVVVEPDVTIDLHREKFMLAGEKKFADAFFSTVSGHFAYTRYEHKEIEGNGEVGTVFKNQGNEWRIEAKTSPYGAWRTIIGASGDSTKFSADGEEAFVPPTQSSNTAIFAKQDGRFGDTLMAFGTRVERARVSASEVFNDEGISKFGPANEKRLTLLSGAFGLTQKLSDAWTLYTNVSYSERAPSYFERYADGIHVATGAYERGDRNLPKEQSTHLDVGLAFHAGALKSQITAFASRHRNFVSLDATGEFFNATSRSVQFTNTGGDVFPIYQFRAVPARFLGAEWETTWRAFDRASQSLDLGLSIDTVRATNRLTDEPLPRIAPTRATFTANYRTGDWQLRGQVIHAAKQDRIPEIERFENAASDGTTRASTMLNVSLSRDFQVAARALGVWRGNAFIKLVNLTNELGYNAASIRSVRELAPLPGRGVRAGLTLTF